MIDNSDLYSIRSWDSGNIFDMDAGEPIIINSSASSETGDYMDFTTERIYNLSDADYLDLPITQILDCSISDWVNEVTCPLTTTTTASTTTSTTESVTNENNTSRRKARSKKCKKHLNPFEIKKWSKLDFYEQNDVIDEITQIISTQMDFRQQLDIIRIIDPKAVVSNTDKQFAIDVSRLNDNKWKAVKDKILRNTNMKIKPARNNKVRRQAEKKNMRRKQIKPQERLELQSDLEDTIKRKKQLRKESRSGLFKKEEILSLSTSYISEEEIDILD